MSKFNEGEIVEVFKTGTPFSVGEKVRLVTKDSDDDWKAEYLDGSDYWYVTEDQVRYTTSNSKEKKPMGRRTFKLIKDTPTVKKGALYQEQCEDGTQPYQVITLDNDLDRSDGQYAPNTIIDRKLVEEAPAFFVEVFKVEPEYMTREQLDAYQAFLGQKKRGRPVGSKNKKVAPATKAKMAASWTPERRKAQARRMRKMHKQGKLRAK